ncbi:MAG: HDIG domain-containing protein [Hydrococcus sp. RU_2_2]|nr:HDIG domain-containing protein [Hydrococcus sp. RU_2_2]NJP22130.1 HDIG domain-containing protein [Hydrococcus sp. CRU_1_1]
MKTFRSLTKQFEEWRRKEQDDPYSAYDKEKDIIGIEQPCPKKPSSNHQGKASSLILILAIASIASVVGYRFYDRPRLAVGTIAPDAIEAPRDERFEDDETTEEKRKAIRTGITPILKRDAETTAKVEKNLMATLDRIEQLRQFVGTFPFVDVKILSSDSQQNLRSASEQTWQSILAVVKASDERAAIASNAKNPSIDRAIAELKTYRQKVPQPEFEALIAKIAIARQRYAKALKNGIGIDDINLTPQTIASFLDLSDRAWSQTKMEIVQATRRILTQGIPQGIPPAFIEETVKMNLSSPALNPVRPIATQLLIEGLHPNLIIDREQTKRRAEEVALAVEPVVVEVKKGDIIVEAGDEIAQEDFVVLDGFGLSRRGISWTGLGATAILVSTAVGLFVVVVRRVHRSLRRRDALLLCLLSLSAPIMAILHPKYTSLPAIGLLVSSFYNPTLAATQVILMGGLTTFAVEADGWEYLLAGTAGGLMSAFIAGRLRSRDEFSLLGVGVGLTQGGVYFAVNLMLSTAAGTVWYAILPGAIIYGLLGLAWSVVALGISPYLERLFDLVTPIRLVELSNPNCDLLKRLATEAPGTFQHTLFVASLAEAAARELHCNVELVRAGTLYHDIGKMHDPLGFIENQMGGPNKHDEINDPWVSTEIIKKHVSEGLVMARKYGLPKVIQNFIPEHQGTLLISYFYFQAKQKAEQLGQPPVCETDFRYAGPIPQSRETCLVMLADACEAALRSLKEVTPEVALTTIHKIFKARWRDEQLTDSGIRYEELPIIAEVFVKVWQQVNHQRIVYPKAALESQPSKKL